MLTRVNGARVPWESARNSPDPVARSEVARPAPRRRSHQQPLAINTLDGSQRRVTDYGNRPIMIVRRVSWSRDSKRIYAAVAETDADIVLFQNLLPDGAPD